MNGVSYLLNDIVKKRLIKWGLGLGIGNIALVLFSFLILLALLGNFIDGKNSNDSGGGDIGISELGEKEIPKEFLPVYKEAGKKYDIAWTLIAAFHKVETNFGTAGNMVSSAGAIGHFQFLPETWLGWGYGKAPPKSVYEDPAMIARYGGYGVDADNDGKADPYNIKDAAFSCANYVSKSGGMADLQSAIFAYNHAQWYVDKVMDYYKMYSSGDYTPVENGGGTSGNGKYKMPVPSPVTITSGYGSRVDPITGTAGEFHKGIDFSGSIATPILAVTNGTVVYSQFNNGGFGNCVIIQHSDGYYSLYGHMSSLNVSVGQSVKTGSKVGNMGTTGSSTGVHLHFGVYKGIFVNPVDPSPFLGL